MMSSVIFAMDNYYIRFIWDFTVLNWTGKATIPVEHFGEAGVGKFHSNRTSMSRQSRIRILSEFRINWIVLLPLISTPPKM